VRPGGGHELGQVMLDAAGEYVEIGVGREVAGDPKVTVPQ
jgi:hypothetical protein